MLDNTDKKIISYLQHDGRMPYTQIAAKLDITEATVRRRASKLIDEGIMQIVAIVEPQHLGWKEAAMIGLQIDLQKIDDVVAKLMDFPEVSYLFQAAGEFDLFLEVYCQDKGQFVSFLNEKLVQISGVLRIQSFMILKMHKLSYLWGQSNPQKPSS